MTTLQNIKELLSTISRLEAENLSLEIYDMSGRKYLVREAYVDEGVFCIDLEPDPNAS